MTVSRLIEVLGNCPYDAKLVDAKGDELIAIQALIDGTLLLITGDKND